MSVGDVNSDGFDDIFIGNAAGQADALFLSQPDGSFLKSNQPAFEKNKSHETTGSVLFDADNDGDLDIYAVSGGTEFRIGSKELRDILYLNDGKGFFTESVEGTLPVGFSNGSCVTAGDFDQDGDEDLFIGGSSISGNFPISAPGGILINESNPDEGIIKFTLGTDQINSDLRQPGIVNDAKWIDANDDHFPDLVIAGEWIPIRIFMNENGKRLVEKTDQMNLGKTSGLWQCIKEADIDGDGDIDFIAGNTGTNMPFKASVDQPVSLYAIDYAGDGNITPVICSYNMGKSYPLASMNEIQDELPDLENKFNRYEDYAIATIEDLFSPEILARSKVLHVNMLESIILINNGQGSFEIKILPQEVQYSAVQGIVFTDITGDGTEDILITGNLFSYRVEYGPSDASIGTLLIGEGNGKYRTASQRESGVWIRGDIRDAELVKTLHSRQIIVAKNNDNLQVLEIKNDTLRL